MQNDADPPAKHCHLWWLMLLTTTVHSTWSMQRFGHASVGQHTGAHRGTWDNMKRLEVVLHADCHYHFHIHGLLRLMPKRRHALVYETAQCAVAQSGSPVSKESKEATSPCLQLKA